jgi:hypothetical protein
MIDVHRSYVPFWLLGVVGADLRPDNELLVHIQGCLLDNFRSLYLDPHLISMAPDVYGKRRYLFPSRCREGTMIYASGSVPVLVLFNKRVRRYVCKVMITHVLL